MSMTWVVSDVVFIVMLENTHENNLKCFIPAENGNQRLEFGEDNLNKEYVLLKVSELYNKSKQSIRLSKYDADFEEWVTLNTEADFQSLVDKEKLQLGVTELIYDQRQESAKVIADITVPVPQEGNPTTLPVFMVPSSDTEDTDGDLSLNSSLDISALSSSTKMDDR